MPDNRLAPGQPNRDLVRQMINDTLTALGLSRSRTPCAAGDMAGWAADRPVRLGGLPGSSARRPLGVRFAGRNLREGSARGRDRRGLGQWLALVRSPSAILCHRVSRSACSTWSRWPAAWPRPAAGRRRGDGRRRRRPLRAARTLYRREIGITRWPGTGGGDCGGGSGGYRRHGAPGDAWRSFDGGLLAAG